MDSRTYYLDYLLAAEGGVCGKFSLISCCVQIDDQGQAVEDLVKQMTILAHEPIQVWHELDPDSLFGGWFSTFGGFKILVAVVLLSLGTCFLLPCLLSLVIQTITSLIQGIVERKTTEKIFVQWDCRSLTLGDQEEDQKDDAL